MRNGRPPLNAPLIEAQKWHSRNTAQQPRYNLSTTVGVCLTARCTQQSLSSHVGSIACGAHTGGGTALNST